MGSPASAVDAFGSSTSTLCIVATYPRRQQHAISYCCSLNNNLLQRNKQNLICFAKCNYGKSSTLTNLLAKQYE